MYLSKCPVSSPGGVVVLEAVIGAPELMPYENNKVPLEFPFFFHSNLDLRHCRAISANSDLWQNLQHLSGGLVSVSDKYFFGFMIYFSFPHRCSK